MVARQFHVLEAAGSSPAPATSFLRSANEHGPNSKSQQRNPRYLE